jgi:hypothetical protein
MPDHLPTQKKSRTHDTNIVQVPLSTRWVEESQASLLSQWPGQLNKVNDLRLSHSVYLWQV